MVEVKLACKVCGKLLDNEKDVMTHYFTEHREVGLYAAPIFVGELPIPMRKPSMPVKPKKKRPEPKHVAEDLDEDMEGYEEMSLD